MSATRIPYEESRRVPIPNHKAVRDPSFWCQHSSDKHGAWMAMTGTSLTQATLRMSDGD